MKLKKLLSISYIIIAGAFSWYIFWTWAGKSLQVKTRQDARQPLVHCGEGEVSAQETHSSVPQLQWTSLIKSAIHDTRVAVNLAENILADEKNFADDLTVVTSYINIGEFQKGESGTVFTPALYRRWMKVFSRIQNPVIAYFDKTSDADYFRHLRTSLPMNLTQIHVVSREELWAFNSLKSRIAQIYADPDYPKHHPNTVVPEYSCAMHAKYEFMLRAISGNPFKTKYFAWVDTGLFRELPQQPEEKFKLYIPPSLDPERVAYGQVAQLVHGIPLTIIFHDNIAWVCGCFFVARASVMARWTIEYMKYTDYFLCRDLMNTDQQIIYAMFNFGTPAVKIQDYRPRIDFNIWFSLGYLCKEEGQKHFKIDGK